MLKSSRCRETKDGWRGRRRTYICRICGQKLQVDTLNPLPEKERTCHLCKSPGKYPFPFIDKVTKENQIVHASNAELATLKAYELNPNLTFDTTGKWIMEYWDYPVRKQEVKDAVTD